MTFLEVCACGEIFYHAGSSCPFGDGLEGDFLGMPVDRASRRKLHEFKVRRPLMTSMKVAAAPKEGSCRHPLLQIAQPHLQRS